jgi:hypothetical protein
MSKLSKTMLGAVGVWAVLTVLHLHMNLGMGLATLTGKKDGKEVAGERFRVGFLPVT